ncbi:hypothetical protein GCM10022244_15790 [Streptomyces gulbargensis]|uniref:Uncharacterized protein n=1 Tax=Streptomyces gulbargensis TaxID=364901 RepID=A0ABP7LS68_9ACTN
MRAVGGLDGRAGLGVGFDDMRGHGSEGKEAQVKAAMAILSTETGRDATPWVPPFSRGQRAAVTASLSP